MTSLKRGSEIEIDIDSLAFGGEGVGKLDGMAVFVRDALPGQRVRARIRKKKKSYAQARLLSVIKTSPYEIPPRCAHFADCGGCVLQHYDYRQQLRAKTAQVKDALKHLAHIESPTVLPILPSPQQFYYRNKMEYTFGNRRWIPKAEVEGGMEINEREFALGLHVRGRFDKILAIDACHLQSEQSNTIRNFVADQTIGSLLRPYTTRDHSGFWRFLVIREGKNTGQTLINIVTANAEETGNREVEKLVKNLVEAVPEITTVVHTINRQKAQVATGQESRVLYGDGVIYEKIGSWRFRLSPESFFQTNTRGAEVLYAQIARLAALQRDEILYDFYCGAGSIGIYLSEQVKKVVGVEIVPEAVRDAEENARLNKVANCHFLCGDLKERLENVQTIISEHGEPDVIVFDPPRAGLHPKVVSRALSFKTKKIVYVSCNPATFARDARLLCDSGYELIETQPVDMFPHTAHIEIVSLFEMK